jgi:hypothetical protein
MAKNCCFVVGKMAMRLRPRIFLDWRQQVLEFSVIGGGILLFCFLREEIVKSVPRSWRRIKLIGFATLLSQYFYLFRRAQE